MIEQGSRRVVVRTALHRASVAVLCGSLGGERRRSAWITEQARLLGSDDASPPAGAPAGVVAVLPRQRRSASSGGSA